MTNRHVLSTRVLAERILAIETSCDDTSAAIVESNGRVVVCLSADQDLAHKPFGGVVPEIASRNHTLQLLPLIDEAFARAKMGWADIDGIAVTSRPGLIGSLLVGVMSAKTLALVYEKRLIGVNHLEAHLLAPFLNDEKFSPPQGFGFPYLALAISGGHTQLYHVKGLGEYEVLGRTVDDAAGEAFDKFAKHLGLGFPGGAKVDREAQNGNRAKYKFPRTMLHEDSFDFSFSGLKAAAVRLVEGLSPQEKAAGRADLCASFQEAVVDSLMAKLKPAQEKTKLKNIVITGGVAANSRLRSVVEDWCRKESLLLAVPPLRFCTDNAAMVGYAGISRLNKGESHGQELTPAASSLEHDFREASR